MTRAVVSGGAGFIGSHLVDALVERGDEVTVLDDLSRGRAARVHPDARLVRCDIADADAVSAAVAQARPEQVYHLAAQADVRVSVQRPGFDAQVNVVGTANVLDAARRAGARVVFSSTGGAMYGEVATIPTPETVEPLPESPYGASKRSGEEYLGSFGRLYGLRHATLRLGNVYGPRQDPKGEAGVVSIFLGALARGEQPRIFGDGAQTRDYVHVADVARACLAAAESARDGLWNIGTGQEVSVTALLERCQAVAGSSAEPEHLPPREGELQRSALDASLAARELDWTPRLALDDGLRSVWEWVRADQPDR